MRISRPRFTVRRLMVAVAVVALIIGIAMMKVRSKSYRARAAAHGASRLVALKRMDFAQSTFHAAMKDKWEAAASRPWLPVEPDPPEPE